MFFVNSFLYVKSIKNAPNGAVIIIDKTATVKTVSPQFNPIESGIPPIAALADKLSYRTVFLLS